MYHLETPCNYSRLAELHLSHFVELLTSWRFISQPGVLENAAQVSAIRGFEEVSSYSNRRVQLKEIDSWVSQAEVFDRQMTARRRQVTPAGPAGTDPGAVREGQRP